jgi:hypothetical protein
MIRSDVPLGLFPYEAPTTMGYIYACMATNYSRGYIYACVASNYSRSPEHMRVVWFTNGDINGNGNNSHSITSGKKFEYDGISF